MKKRKIWLAPHNDDETLFGAFTIMREKPLVVIVTDSYIQYLRGDGITAEQRRSETKKAMGKLGAEVHFLGIHDNDFTKELLASELRSIPRNTKDKEIIFAPMIEGGNNIHDIIGEMANEMFDNVLHYSTYTKSRPYPSGDIEVKPTQEERNLKNEMLEEYYTQKIRHNKVYFQMARTRSEYFNSGRFAGTITSLKEQALKNLVDTKRVFDELRIPFCLMDGTLLGAYRDGDFIAGDYDDTDIGFDARYFEKVPLIFKKLEERGLKKHKQWNLRGRFEGGAVKRGGNHVDFFCIHKKGKEAYNLGRNFLPDNSKEYMAYVYPAENFIKYDKLIFKGMEFNIPNKVEGFLKIRYGDWKTPIGRGEGFNWLNREQNPCLTTDYET